MNSKLPDVGTSIFTIMSKLALEHNAINLAQGFPNFPVDERLIEIVKEVSSENFHQYAAMGGNLTLLEQIQELTLNSYQRKITNEEILITAGATQGIFTTIQALIHTEDKVIIIDPAYDCYAPAVRLAGGIPVHVSMQEDFTVDWNKVNDSIDEKCKMLIINNPHNPSGKILNENDLNSIFQIVQKNPQLYLLADEVYEYIVFGEKHLSINLYKKLHDKSIIVSSFGKTFHVTGWKIAYLIAPKNIMEEIKKVHQYLVFSVNSIAQESIHRYLKIVNVKNLSKEYLIKRDFFSSSLKQSLFTLLPCEGTYFQCVSYEKISTQTDVQFSRELVQKHRVAVIPLSVFYKTPPKNQILRLCFAKDQNTLTKVAEILSSI
ncbi:MAG: aminotransferase class I/II-fold pyridoxal phosphate-dependent enzyme [Flavobacteriia bacterium]|nr:aminotransferase class I/II-fold pyridoxal phosphate-dependent enzyme [Flavobacteriia bacterium]